MWRHGCSTQANCCFAARQRPERGTYSQVDGSLAFYGADDRWASCPSKDYDPPTSGKADNAAHLSTQPLGSLTVAGGFCFSERAQVRILVCGSRDFSDRALMDEALNAVAARLDPEPILIHGDARGADRMAGHEGLIRGWWVWRCEAKWNQRGKAAGPIRNQRMLEQARPEWALAFPIGNSKGTADMLRRLDAAEVPTWIIRRTDQGMGIEIRNVATVGVA